MIEIIKLNNTELKKVLLRDKIMEYVLKGITIPFLTFYIIEVLKNIITF